MANIMSSPMSVISENGTETVTGFENQITDLFASQ
jgi:hypothetical protein